MKIKLLQDYGKYKAGAKLEVDDDTFKELTENGTAELFDEAKALAEEIAAKAADEAMKKTIDEKVAEATKEIQAKLALVTVGEDRETQDMKGGFLSTAHFLTDVRLAKASGRSSEKLTKWLELSEAMVKAASGNSESVDADGGYLVPEEMSNAMMQPAIENSIIASRAFQLPMTSKQLKVNALIDKDHSESIGGVICYWDEEAGSYTSSKPKFRRINLVAHKLTALTYLTEELIEDSSVSMEAFINTIVPQALAWFLDEALLNGDGAGKPLGILNAANPALLAQAKEAAQTADTINYNNLLKMRSRHREVNVASTIWVAIRDAMVQFGKLTLEGTSNSIPVWMPAGGISGLPYDSFYGRPLIYSEKMQTLGDQSDVALLDVSQYFFGLRRGVKSTSSMHVKFLTDEIAYKFSMRVAGAPGWNTTFKPKKGSTVSPFVTLAERA